MESIKSLYKDEIRLAFDLFIQNAIVIKQNFNPATSQNVHTFPILEDSKNRLSSRGQVYIYHNFSNEGIARIYRSSNKTYPGELAKVKTFFTNQNVDDLRMITSKFDNFLNSCILSNGTNGFATIVHPLFLSKIEQILNDKKVILSSGKFSSKSFILNGDVQLLSNIKLIIPDLVAAVLHEDVSLDLYIKIIQDLNARYKDLNVQLRSLSHRLINSSIYSEQTAMNYRKKNTELNSSIIALKTEILNLKKNTNQIVRHESKVTTSSALTWR